MGNNVQNQEVRDRLEKGRAWIVENHPLFTPRLMKMRFVEDLKCDVGYTNGKVIGYNPNVLQRFTLGDTIFFIAHEVGHVYGLHHIRLADGSYDHHYANVAMDHEVNLLLMAAGLQMKAESVLADPAYKGLAWEQIYPKVYRKPVRPPQPPKGGGNEWDDEGEGGGEGDWEDVEDGVDDDDDLDGQKYPMPKKPSTDESEDEGKDEDEESGSGGGAGEDDGDDEDEGEESEGGSSDEGEGDDQADQVEPQPWGEVRPAESEDGEELTGAELDAEATEVISDLVQGAQFAKKAGNGGGGALDRFINDRLIPRTTARELLQHICEEDAKSQYTWSRVSRRHNDPHVLFPGIHDPSVGKLVVAVDTSGSINRDALMRFRGVIEDILRSYPGTEVHVKYCDWIYHSNHDQFFDSAEDIEFRPVGGGGTHFMPLFRAIEADDEQPIAMVFLTDMCFSYTHDIPKDAPEYPVVWAVPEEDWTIGFGRDVPWGEVGVV